MSHQILRHGFLRSTLLFAGVTLGCATVVTPISPSDTAKADENHGLLVGTIQLIQAGTAQSAALQWPREMQWWVEEQTSGSRILINHLPLDGPFVLKLPPGSYRVTDITFRSIRGIWHTVLPTTFSIQSEACTTLGIWELEMQTGFFTGWVTRQVSHEQEFDQDEFGRFLDAKGCPTLVAPLDYHVKRSVGLYFHTRGSRP